VVAPDLRKALVRAGRELHGRAMTPGAAGNLSARLDGDRFLITPSGAAKGRLRPADLLIVDAAGRLVEGAGRPSSETPMHLAIYRRFPHVGAVVHAHPPAATALAITHRAIAVEALPEALFALGSVPSVPYLPPTSPELGEAVAAALDEGDGCLLLNHGAVTIGRTVAEALGKMEVLEALADVTLRSALAGPVAALPPAEVERLRAIWRNKRNR
jgi:L-fuculose-phosphate aldolase